MKLEELDPKSKKELILKESIDAMWTCADAFMQDWIQNIEELDTDNYELIKNIYLEGYKTGFQECRKILDGALHEFQTKVILSNLKK